MLAEAKVWRTATTRERLVGDAHIRMKKKTLKTASSITIATWLDELHDLRRKIKHWKTSHAARSKYHQRALVKLRK